ncbi:predicted protein, partial [Nematostella vectensis]
MKRYYQDILREFMLVSIGAKASLLFDYAYVESSKMFSLLQDLQSQNILENALSVVVLGEDIIICDMCKIITFLEVRLQENDFVVVDISVHLKKPKVICKKEQFLQLLEQMRHRLLECGSEGKPCQEKALILHIDTLPDWNISSLFGFLLGYPVIYWYDKVGDYNCLAMEPLYLYQVFISTSTCLHFEKLRNTKKMITKGNEKMQMISFSAPQCLFPHFESCVERWKAAL